MVLQMVSARVAPMALGMGVRVEVRCRSSAVLENRASNLVVLILANLLENAMQATPRGKRVELTILDQDGETVCRVRDEGQGISDAIRDRLFSPVVSTKEGGSGLGLAISRQLAQHLGARLECVASDKAGSTFELAVPSVRKCPGGPGAAEVRRRELAGSGSGSCA